MKVDYWGRGGWYLLFYLIKKYNDQFGVLCQLIDFTVSNLPCKECSQHANEMINKNKIYSTNTNEIFNFFISFFLSQHQDFQYRDELLGLMSIDNENDDLGERAKMSLEIIKRI